jgi:hypothetical protein
MGNHYVTPASPYKTAPITPAGPSANQGVGAGSSGQAPGAIPPANPEGLVAYSYSAAVLDSIPAGDSEDSTVMCLEVASHLQDVCQKLYAGQVQCDDQQRQAALAEKLAQLKDALDKLAHLQDDHHSFWDVLGDIFGAIASILAIVVGVVLCCTGAGAVVGGFAIAGGVLGLISTANSITMQLNNGVGIAGAIVKACGGSDKDVENADLAFGLTVAALSLVCAAVCFFNAPQNVGTLVQTLRTTSALVSAGTTIVSAGGQVSVAVIDYENAQKQGDAKRSQARAAELTAWVTEIDQFIDVALKNMKASAEAWAGTVRTAAETLSDVNLASLQIASAA